MAVSSYVTVWKKELLYEQSLICQSVNPLADTLSFGLKQQ